MKIRNLHSYFIQAPQAIGGFLGANNPDILYFVLS